MSEDRRLILDAFDRIWKNQAIGGDYQSVQDFISGNDAPTKKYQKVFLKYRGVKEYRRQIEERERQIIIGCNLLRGTLEHFPDNSADKKRIKNYLKNKESL